MNRRELLITGGVIVLGLLMAFPLTWLFRPGTSPGRSAGYGPAIHQTDANGADWTITPMAGRSPATAGKDTQTKPSLIVRTDVFDRGNRELLIGLVLEGRDGQRYQPVVSTNGVRQPVPTLRVVDEAGKVILDDSFQYGWGGTCRYSWRVPEDFTGKFQVQVGIDLGPFEVEHDQPWHSLWSCD